MDRAQQLHVHYAFLYISLPSLLDFDVKIPNFTFYKLRRNYPFLFKHRCNKFFLKESSPTFDKVNESL